MVLPMAYNWNSTHSTPDSHAICFTDRSNSISLRSINEMGADYGKSVRTFLNNQSDISLELPQTLSCLIVDDTSSNRKILGKLVRLFGIQVTFAENGLEAIEAIRDKSNYFDFVFMDYTMPVMAGDEAVRRIRAENFKNLIFGVTGNALDDDMELFMAAGADFVFSKPLQHHTFQAILEYVRDYGCISPQTDNAQISFVDDALIKTATTDFE